MILQSFHWAWWSGWEISSTEVLFMHWTFTNSRLVNGEVLVRQIRRLKTSRFSTAQNHKFWKLLLTIKPTLLHPPPPPIDWTIKNFWPKFDKNEWFEKNFNKMVQWNLCIPGPSEIFFYNTVFNFFISIHFFPGPYFTEFQTGPAHFLSWLIHFIQSHTWIGFQ